jgi:hypothetical protein
MRTRPAKICSAIALVAVVVILAGSCRHCPPSVDGSRLDVSLTGADSPEQIENMIRASLAYRFPPTNIAGSYTMYQVTNGLLRCVFFQVGNAPRGLDMFNLYCYEQETSNIWLLRGYVPVNAHFYTNSLDRGLRFHVDNDYVKVLFRDAIVFTITSKKIERPNP